MPDLDLEPQEYRPVMDKPLMRRGPLIWGMMFFGLMMVLAIIFAWGGGGIFSVSTAVMGVGFGIAWAGLAPGFWFRDGQRANSRSSRYPRG